MVVEEILAFLVIGCVLRTAGSFLISKLCSPAYVARTTPLLPHPGSEYVLPWVWRQVVVVLSGSAGGARGSRPVVVAVVAGVVPVQRGALRILHLYLFSQIGNSIFVFPLKKNIIVYVHKVLSWYNHHMKMDKTSHAYSRFTVKS